MGYYKIYNSYIFLKRLYHLIKINSIRLTIQIFYLQLL